MRFLVAKIWIAREQYRFVPELCLADIEKLRQETNDNVRRIFDIDADDPDHAVFLAKELDKVVIQVQPDPIGCFEFIPNGKNYSQIREDFQKVLAQTYLKACNGNISRVSRRLQVNRNTVYRFLGMNEN